MAIITLTTDFGDRDYYAPAFKGEILSACPGVQVVDISNTIAPFSVSDAAYLIRNAFPHFPKRSIHVARVHEMQKEHPDLVVCSYKDHFFIAPDNGLLSMVFEGRPGAAVKVDSQRIKVRSSHELYCRAIRTIVYNGSLSDLGMPVNDLELRTVLRPTIRESSIRGVVQHIDNYGNVITNITVEDLESVRQNGTFNLILRRNENIRKLDADYTDVPLGEQLARFNGKGYLEIAIHGGRADDLLGLTVGDNIKIEC